MSEAASYSVVMTGQITEGEALVDVKHNVAMLFNVVGPKLDQMFTGKPVAVRRNVDRLKADEICAALLDAGVIAKVKSEKATAESEEKPSATVVEIQSGQVVAETSIPRAESSIAEPTMPSTHSSHDLGCPHCGAKIEVQLLKSDQAFAKETPSQVAEQPQAPALEQAAVQPAAEPVAEETIISAADPAAEIAEPVSEERAAQLAEIELETDVLAETTVVTEAEDEPVAEALTTELPEVPTEIEEPAVDATLAESAAELMTPAAEAAIAEEAVAEETVVEEAAAEEVVVEEAAAEIAEAGAEEAATQPEPAIEEVAAQQAEETESAAALAEQTVQTPEPAATVAPIFSLEGFEPDLQCPRCAHEQSFSHQCGLCSMDLRQHIRRLHRKERMRANRLKMMAQANA